MPPRLNKAGAKDVPLGAFLRWLATRFGRGAAVRARRSGARVRRNKRHRCVAGCLPRRAGCVNAWRPLYTRGAAPARQHERALRRRRARANSDGSGRAAAGDASSWREGRKAVALAAVRFPVPGASSTLRRSRAFLYRRAAASAAAFMPLPVCAGELVPGLATRRRFRVAKAGAALLRCLHAWRALCLRPAARATARATWAWHRSGLARAPAAHMGLFAVHCGALLDVVPSGAAAHPTPRMYLLAHLSADHLSIGARGTRRAGLRQPVYLFTRACLLHAGDAAWSEPTRARMARATSGTCHSAYIISCWVGWETRTKVRGTASWRACCAQQRRHRGRACSSGRRMVHATAFTLAVTGLTTTLRTTFWRDGFIFMRRAFFLAGVYRHLPCRFSTAPQRLCRSFGMASPPLFRHSGSVPGGLLVCSPSGYSQHLPDLLPYLCSCCRRARRLCLRRGWRVRMPSRNCGLRAYAAH